MKRNLILQYALFGFGFSLSATQMQATPLVKQPLLSVEIGRLDTVKNIGGHCVIDINHPLLAKLRTEFPALKARSKTAELGTAYHFMAQEPSIEVYIYDAPSDQAAQDATMLFSDHDTVQYRTDAKLLALAREEVKLCGLSYDAFNLPVGNEEHGQ